MKSMLSDIPRVRHWLMFSIYVRVSACGHQHIMHTRDIRFTLPLFDRPVFPRKYRTVFSLARSVSRLSVRPHGGSIVSGGRQFSCDWYQTVGGCLCIKYPTSDWCVCVSDADVSVDRWNVCSCVFWPILQCTCPICRTVIAINLRSNSRQSSGVRQHTETQPTVCWVRASVRVRVRVCAIKFIMQTAIANIWKPSNMENAIFRA